MTTNILLIGCGGREHSIAKALKKDNTDINPKKKLKYLICIPNIKLY